VIEQWSEGPPGDGMPEAMLVETLRVVERHPWWAARARLTTSLLRAAGVAPPASVIDVGCGWGVNLQSLEAAGYRVTGLDASREILDLIDAPQRTLVHADLAKPLPAGHERYQGAIMLDVLEHLDDDRAALQRVAELVLPGGTLVVSVPALPELFSDFDRIQGHRRRYVPDTLRAAFQDSGFRLKTLQWWGRWMIPVAKLTRLNARAADSDTKSYSDYLRLLPWPAPWLMRALYAIEGTRPVLTRLRRGTTLLAVASRD
jgi:SAM-dependent methyltransferase